MEALWFLFMFTPFRWLILAVAAFIAAWAVWILLPAGRSRYVLAAITYAAVFFSPEIHRWGAIAIADYYREKSRWLSEMCKATESGLAVAEASTPIQTEGVLDQTQYQDLSRVRIEGMVRRSQRLEGRTAGGVAFPLDTLPQHLVSRFGLDGAFVMNALAILKRERLSFVEFEMRPLGTGTYTNAEDLTPKNWFGVKYRRYFLAVPGHPACVWDNAIGDYVLAHHRTASIGTPLISYRARRPAGTYCLAMEIADRSLAGVRIVADDSNRSHFWIAKIRGISVPIWTPVQWERVTVHEVTSRRVREHDRRVALKYPSIVEATFDCSSVKGDGTSLFANWFVADSDRRFLRSKDWYAGSSVESYYERGVMFGEPDASRRLISAPVPHPARSASPPVRR